MAIDETMIDFIGGRWSSFSGKKKPKQLSRMILPMVEEGWRPVTVENPLNQAPPSINALIIKCCSHEPKDRPSFADIYQELSSSCKTEIEEANFYRRDDALNTPSSAWEDPLTKVAFSISKRMTVRMPRATPRAFNFAIKDKDESHEVEMATTIRDSVSVDRAKKESLGSQI